MKTYFNNTELYLHTRVVEHKRLCNERWSLTELRLMLQENGGSQLTSYVISSIFVGTSHERSKFQTSILHCI